MGVFSQLRLLLWRNLLQQWRSFWFTVFEFAIPFVLIGITFGLMLGFRSQFEDSHGVTNYPYWPVMGSGFDTIMPTNASDPDSTMMDLSKFWTGNEPKCQFLSLNVTEKMKSAVIGIDFYYSPNTTITNDLMARLQARYNISNMLADPNFSNYLAYQNIPIYTLGAGASIQCTCNVIGFATEADMVNNMKNSFESQCQNPLLAGIVFDDSIANNLNSASNLSYTIRTSNTMRRHSDEPWDVSQKFAYVYTTGPYEADDADGGYPAYWKEGLITTQKAIDVVIGDYLTNSTISSFNNTNLLMSRYPYPAYQDKIIEIGAYSVPGIVVFSFMTSVVYIVRILVVEKEDRLKEYMTVMGLSGWILWLSHFILNYCKVLITVVVLTIFMSIITPQSDWSIMFVCLLLYAFNCVYIGFFISTLTQSATTGTFLATMLWTLLYLWQIIFITYDQANPFSLGVQLLNCINPDIALNYAVELLASFESQSNGLHWSDFWTPVSPDEGMVIGHVILFLIGDGLFFLLATWYVEAVFPGGESVSQAPWFFILPSYWFPARTNKKIMTKDSPSTKKPYYLKLEPDPENKTVAVDVVGLSKTYGTGYFTKCFNCNFNKNAEKKALDGLDLRIYEGQITALLGHNGAGKSTTFALLTGVGSPTSGTAYIDNYDIRNSLPAIRKKLGLCPQYNILFSKLTVMEHLEFFCKLKERKWNPSEALELITKLRIEFKADAYAGSLSGGQKRKLSLAIALIGGSEIIMLDEPTSGMDPGARHQTWSLLQAERANRTILLTTHFMEEADVLGDRIAILAHGKLQCCGSGLFLKGQYGAGYHLVMVYENQPQIEETLSVIQKHVPEATVASVAGQEGAFLLPANYRAQFSTLFKDLESNQNRLGVTSFGVSITTMEEVFLKVGQEATERYNKENGIKDESDSAVLKENDPVLQKLKATRKVTGSELYFGHAKAMFTKRLIYFKRRWPMFLSQTIFPIAYLAIMMTTSNSIPTVKEQKALPINFNDFVINGKGYITSSMDNYNGSSLLSQLNQTINLMNPPANLVVQGTANVTSYILTQTKAAGSRTFGEHYPVSLSKEINGYGEMIRAYFNNFAYTSAPLSVMLSDSIFLTAAMKGKRNITISVTNHPLPPSSQDALKNKDNSNSSGYIIGYAIVTCMALIISGNAVFLIRERKKKSKHMQILSGLSLWMFWLTTFIFDFVWYLMRVAAFIIIFFIFKTEEYTDSLGTVLTLILIQLLFGWTSIPQTYWLSFKFTSAPKGYKLLVLFHILTGIVGLIAAPIIQQTDGRSATNTFNVVYSFFFPTFNVANCFIQVYNNEFAKESCAKLDCSALISPPDYCCSSDKSKLVYSSNILGDGGEKGILWPILFMSAQGFFYWYLVYLREKEVPSIADRIKKLFKKKNKISPGFGDEEKELFIEDSDVIDEKQKAEQLSPKSSAVLVKDLKKWYGNFNAVKGVSFHVNTGECFGLLGVNGAGKTSTFQMLTGENSVSEGDAFILGSSVTTDWRNVGDRLGYCPQFDAIIKEMTGEETLYMFARIRGIHPEDIDEKVKAVIKAIGIEMYADKQIKTYSGGNKRRLSLGIALVGLPEVLLLDEPTTGVDPKARRTIWNILSCVRSLGTAIVLVSHSMEECEALCTELTIMVYGRFRCYGSCQHIKTRYGTGFTLLIRLKNPTDADIMKREIYSRFKGAQLKEQHISQLNFELPRTESTTWSGLFEEIEQITDSFEDYSLSQTTLEQVFLEFSRAANAPIDD